MGSSGRYRCRQLPLVSVSYGFLPYCHGRCRRFEPRMFMDKLYRLTSTFAARAIAEKMRCVPLQDTVRFPTSEFPCGLHRPTSEILQERFRVLLHEAGKSEGWSSGNFRQSLYSDCTADLEIVAFSAILAFSESVS